MSTKTTSVSLHVHRKAQREQARTADQMHRQERRRARDLTVRSRKLRRRVLRLAQRDARRLGLPRTAVDVDMRHAAAALATPEPDTVPATVTLDGGAMVRFEYQLPSPDSPPSELAFVATRYHPGPDTAGVVVTSATDLADALERHPPTG